VKLLTLPKSCPGLGSVIAVGTNRQRQASRNDPDPCMITLVSLSVTLGDLEYIGYMLKVIQGKTKNQERNLTQSAYVQSIIVAIP